jgi:hypothetical protein
MSDNDLDSIVRRANQQLANQPGFLGCSIANCGPPHIVEYYFDSGPNAELFRSERELNAGSTGFQYNIENQQPNVVLEIRPR